MPLRHNNVRMLPFLDRTREMARLRRAISGRESAFVVLHGRRRLGKSRLLREAMAGRPHVCYVGDERDASIQRAALAREIGRLLPGFGDVRYDGWEPLLDRWRMEAPRGAVLALDEFQYMASASPEIPGLLQKTVDLPRDAPLHLAICGSSQRMMQGFVLDASAPLYGRAREIIALGPLGAGWIGKALGYEDPVRSVEDHAVWGGVPRYLELAAGHRTRSRAIADLVLDPLGVLHREPERILLDDLAGPSRAASILALIGQGCHRLSEIGGRLGVASTSLSRPIARLVDLGLVAREVPFGSSQRGSKTSLYGIGDPLLRFWYRFVEPNRSRLESGRIRDVEREIAAAWPAFLGAAWEDLARQHVGREEILGTEWSTASRWWGRDTGGGRIELDVVAEAAGDPGRVLVGEAKLSIPAASRAGALSALQEKAARCPALAGRSVQTVLFVMRRGGDGGGGRVLGAAEVVGSLV